jgi:DNA-binding response OmpR family regulator
MIDTGCPKVILVADDDDDIREIIASSVSMMDYIVIQAADGLQALSKTQETEVDLLILDWMMPAMTGLEVCQQFKQTDAGKHVPVLILTARDEIQDKVEAFEDGADDFLSKPFDFKELQARVKALLRMRAMNLILQEKNKQLALMQQQLVEQQRQLAVNQLAGAAAHRIGQPLAAMLLNFHLLEELDPGEPSFKTVVASLRADLKRTIQMIEDLQTTDANVSEDYYGELSILGDAGEKS